MSKSGVTPEMLMALADREIDRDSANSIEEAARADAALAEQLATFRATRQAARDAFADVLAEPVPERLVHAVLSDGLQRGNVVAFPLRRRLQQAALPLAACLALALGIAGYFLGQSALAPQPSSLGALAYGDPAVIEALGKTPSNASLILHEGRADTTTLQVANSYRVEGGYCRVFSLSRAADSVRGLGCKRGTDWTIEAVVADAPVRDSQYRPASGATELLEAALDSLGASDVLTAEVEKKLIAGGWME